MTDPLIIDCYAGDGPKDWKKLVAAGAPWHGAILKATQGLHYAPQWFVDQSRLLLEAAGPRFGIDFFRGAYHYLDVSADGVAQADYFLAHVERAGGFAVGDLWPMVDVEHAGQKMATRAQVEDCVSSFAAAIGAKSGRLTTLYGGSYLYDLGITSRMGCSKLAIARYTPTLPEHVLTRIGWDEASLLFWQYCGDGVAELAGYPHEAPGCGKIDISALVMPGGVDALRLAL